MWTPTITRIDKSLEKLVVSVSFSDGVQTIPQVYTFTNGTQEEILAFIAQRVKDFETVAKTGNELSVGVVDTTAKQAVASDIYVENLRKLRSFKEQARLGLIAEDDAQIVTLTQWLKDNYDESYISFF